MLSFLTLPLCVNIKKNLRVCLVVRTQSHTRHDKNTAVKVKSKSLTRGLGDSILAAPVWETFSEVRYHTHDYFHFFPGNVVSCSYFTIFGKSIFSFGGISTYGGGCFNTPHISHRQSDHTFMINSCVYLFAHSFGENDTFSVLLCGVDSAGIGFLGRRLTRRLLHIFSL